MASPTSSARHIPGTFFQQPAQSLIYLGLALFGRQLQNPQILLAALGSPSCLLQHIERHAEPARRKQLVAITVVLEGPRLAHQPVDDVAIVHAMLPPPTQARHLLHLLLAVPDFHLVHVQPRLHLLADQPARHRVHIPIHVDQTARVHLHPLPLARLHAPFRQLLHHRHLFRQAVACVRRSSAPTTSRRNRW